MTWSVSKTDALNAVAQIASSALRRDGHPAQGQITIESAVFEAVSALNRAGLIPPPQWRDAE